MSKFSRFLQSRIFWIQTISISLIALCLVVGLSYAWNTPSCDPTYIDPSTCNVDTPLNVGTTTQTKAGGLNISGNVGIGTTPGSYKLNVNGNMYATAYYGDGSHLTGISTGGDNLGNHTATQDLNMANYNINNTGEVNGKWLHMSQTGNNSIMGNLGIGTTNPGAKLDIQDSSPVGIKLFHTGVGHNDPAQIIMDESTANAGKLWIVPGDDFDAGATNDFLVIGDYSTKVERFWFRGDGTAYLSGNVGIGTTNPGAKLDVSGNILASQSNFIIDRPNTTGGWARGIMYYPTNTYSGTELGGIGMYGSN
ncbi:MAG TPA: hypothetical protein ENL06_01675, partial [Candidatus Portnoybacteria bacterium]|nr:hypothetical protein [Candidatus Portnoybacteria bacterium]